MENATADFPTQSMVLLRFSGDVTTKAPPTRRRFLQRLVGNIKDALSSQGIEHRINRTHDRIFVEFPRDQQEHAVDALSRIFGVQSLAVVEKHGWETLDDLVETGHAFFAESVRDKTFAVRARRVGDRRAIPFQSEEVQRRLGSALLPHARGVSLKQPESEASLEIMPGEAYFFRENIPSRGGLPLGCEGRAVALVSGGFDSPVAAWLMMKRGVALDYVFCNLGGRDHQLETLRVMKVVSDRWSYGTRPHFHAVDFDEITRDLQEKVTTRYWQVVLKRLMLRTAEMVAAERDASAIITGDAVGQVSSQTLQNIAAISPATSLPILRPLVGHNKEEIIRQAREVGTHDLSAKVKEYCAIVPSKPATRATRDQLDYEERNLDLNLLEKAVSERSVFDLRTLDLNSLERPEIQTSEIPPEAIVLDLRSKAAYQGWHYPEALFLDFHNALRVYTQFEAGRPYVLYCEFGLKSGHLAELMQREGLDARHFAGGLKALIAHAGRQGLDIASF
ncbi:MAG: tRNA 4-thiouridine(8) synthase ThiI [Myxococcota bacterium]|nr:tRNA 4-thiouridine(8) synthase ThiI [Myxococcota bacterium]